MVQTIISDADNTRDLIDTGSRAESLVAERRRDSGSLPNRFACTSVVSVNLHLTLSPTVVFTKNKTFSRIEYVKRHALSHTNEYRFQCSRCSKAFARKDVLIRHEKQHSTHETSEAQSPPSNRPRIACLLCRIAKLSCNGGRPCSRCKRSRNECVYRVGSVEPLPIRISPVGPASLQLRPDEAVTGGGICEEPSSIPITAGSASACKGGQDVFAAATHALNETLVGADVQQLDIPWEETQISYGEGMNFDLSSVFNVDADDYLLSFGILGGSNQGSGIPDYNKLWPAVSSFLPIDQAQVQAQATPRTLPPLPQGIYSRAASPEATLDATEEWPTVWDPTSQTDDAGPGPNPQLAEVDLPQGTLDANHKTSTLPAKLTEGDRIGLLELLSFADFKIETFHSLYVRLARISTRTLDHFLHLYFNHVHNYLTWCHVPSFNTRRVSGFLLGMLLAVGAQYSRLPGARAFSHVLGDIVHRAIGNIVITNNAFARDIQLWQACIIWTQFKNSGVPKLTEYTEVFRNSFVVPLEKMHVFDGLYKLPESVTDDRLSTDVRWTQWQTWEGRKRTGFAAFLSDVEFTLYFDRPSVMAPMDLKYGLPCSDVLWEASTADQWLSIVAWCDLVDDAEHAACEILRYRQQSECFWRNVRRSAYASLVCVQILRIANWHHRQAGHFQTSIVQAVESEHQMALLALGGGVNEFCPIMPNESIGWRSFAVAYHLAYITSRIPTSIFLALAGRSSQQRALEARSEILSHMKGNMVNGRSMTLHAGQAIRLLRDSSSENGVEVFELLISGLVISLYSRAATEVETAANAFVPAFSINLDCRQASAMELAFIQNGGSCSLGDIQLSDPNAPRRILTYTADLMERRRCWDIRLAFIRILRRMADHGGMPTSVSSTATTES